MNGTVEEWIAKAEGDFRTAEREVQADECPNYGAVCFHCQQCVEKLLKAVLIEHGTRPPRIHDLLVLSDQVRNLDANWMASDAALRFLTQGATMFRYPAESATCEHAEQAFAFCTRLREDLLNLLGKGDE
ncbi:MAG: HEPN domain-containing protein [Phycisphaerae bacterium]|jgi:HEPN domain-containing protein